MKFFVIKYFHFQNKIWLALFSYCSHQFSDMSASDISSVKLQGLISGTAETKEQAAEGLGELIDVTSEKTLKEVVVPITGYGFILK